MTEPDEVFEREVVRRHELRSAPLTGATEPEAIFQREVLNRHRLSGTTHADTTPEPGGRALANPADPQAVAADRAWLAAMMASRTAGD
ncbi:hypothetical protein [Nonomuraea sp. NPDC049400]|uniref:hypothetical protein n=1 Tax=Nonomuraea sp. NPDC049400 TaxID=3364352 RepID=UPI00378C0B04